jgi:hypothetical protein
MPAVQERWPGVPVLALLLELSHGRWGLPAPDAQTWVARM